MNNHCNFYLYVHTNWNGIMLLLWPQTKVHDVFPVTVLSHFLLHTTSCSNMEKAMVPHPSTLAWKIPWTEEPGGLQSMGSLRVRRLSDFPFTFHFHALEKEMATHSSVLAWRIPGTREPGGLQSMGSHRVRHDWSDVAAAAACSNNYFIYSSNE